MKSCNEQNTRRLDSSNDTTETTHDLHVNSRIVYCILPEMKPPKSVVRKIYIRPQQGKPNPNKPKVSSVAQGPKSSIRLVKGTNIRQHSLSKAQSRPQSKLCPNKSKSISMGKRNSVHYSVNSKVRHGQRPTPIR